MQEQHSELELEKAEAVLARRRAVREAVEEVAAQKEVEMKATLQEMSRVQGRQEREMKAARKEEKRELLQRVTEYIAESGLRIRV